VQRQDRRVGLGGNARSSKMRLAHATIAEWDRDPAAVGFSKSGCDKKGQGEQGMPDSTRPAPPTG